MFLRPGDPTQLQYPAGCSCTLCTGSGEGESSSELESSSIGIVEPRGSGGGAYVNKIKRIFCTNNYCSVPIKHPWVLETHEQTLGVGTYTEKLFVHMYVFTNHRNIGNGGGSLHGDGHLLRTLRYHAILEIYHIAGHFRKGLNCRESVQLTKTKCLHLYMHTHAKQSEP